MPRNLDRRIELLIPVEDSLAKSRLIEILEAYFDDNAKARALAAEREPRMGLLWGKSRPPAAWRDGGVAEG